LLCLALIPPSIVTRAFYIIVSDAFQIPELARFLFYFKRTYIGLTDYEFQMNSEAFGLSFGENLVFSSLGPPMDYSGFLIYVFFFLVEGDEVTFYPIFFKLFLDFSRRFTSNVFRQFLKPSGPCQCCLFNSYYIPFFFYFFGFWYMSLF